MAKRRHDEPRRSRRPRPGGSTPTPNTPTNPSIPVSLLPAVGSTRDIKVASSNLFLINDQDVPVEIMTDLIFEDIGGQEIINIARNTSINGQDAIYQPIKNVSSLALQYNPQNILPVENTSNLYFNNFSLKLENYIPVSTFSDPIDGVEAVYIEQYSGDIIINLVNMSEKEQVEIQIFKTGSSIDDTIY